MLAFMSWSLAQGCRTPAATRVPRGVTHRARPKRIRRSPVTSTVADAAQRRPVTVRQLLTLSDLAQIWPIGASGADRNELHLGAPNQRYTGDRRSLGFRGYAAASSQARRRTLISSGVGWSGRDALNLAAMMTRRSLAAMSAVDGWALLAYQGARARWSATSAGSWPAVAYQQVAMAWQASWNGTVRSTAAAVRLRACPAPKTCRASSIATAIGHC